MNEILFTGTSLKDLVNTFKSELIELKKELSKEFEPKQPTEYLSRKEVCDLLKIDLSTLWRWQKQGIVKAYGVANRVYFKRSELEELINKNRIN